MSPLPTAPPETKAYCKKILFLRMAKKESHMSRYSFAAKLLYKTINSAQKSDQMCHSMHITADADEANLFFGFHCSLGALGYHHHLCT